MCFSEPSTPVEPVNRHGKFEVRALQVSQQVQAAIRERNRLGSDLRSRRYSCDVVIVGYHFGDRGLDAKMSQLRCIKQLYNHFIVDIIKWHRYNNYMNTMHTHI